MPNPVTNFIRRYFGFSSNEIRGLYMFVPIIVLIVFIPQLFKAYLSDEKAEDSEDRALLEEWRAETSAKIVADTLSAPKIVLRHFNPNKLTTKEWTDLGFKEEIANRILNYRMKGGTFKKKEDLLKIYGINQRLVRDYEKYIVIPVKETKEIAAPVISSYKSKPKRKFVKVDLGRADTTQLMKINGIGPYWSKRIVRYRNELGGFQNTSQLYEMYGMDSSLVDLVIEHTFFQKLPLERININQDSAQFLANHPYISFKTANAIVRYRKQHGDYSSVAQIKKIVSIPDSAYQKMSPYLKAVK